MNNVKLFLDTETGGLDPKKSSLLELAIIAVQDDTKIIDSYHRYMYPDDRIVVTEPEAIHVNKLLISEVLREGVSYMIATKELIDFIARFKGATVVGHNVSFDLGFIWEYLIPRETWNDVLSYRVLDTASIGMFLRDCGIIDVKSVSLINLAKFFNIPTQKVHTAYFDALRTSRVYNRMKSLNEKTIRSK